MIDYPPENHPAEDRPLNDIVLRIVTAPRRDSLHWKQTEITWDELVSWGDNPGNVKECGNYLLGLLEPTVQDHSTKKRCKALHRVARAVVERDAIQLDADHNAQGLPDRVEMLTPYQHWIHTTYSSNPTDPRYRLVFPTSRPMTPEEYFMVSTVLIDMLGRQSFDPSCVEPSRYMFRPATQRPDWFESRVVEGDLVDVDELLAEFDASTLPVPKIHPNKRDPFSLEGVVGAFNRVYDDFDALIEEYDLPYESVGANRWHLVGASSEAGLGLVSEGLVYSHHANDPAWGVACSAFDLVRLHRFGELDEGVSEKTPINRRPSHEAMLRLATEDKRVVAETIGVDFADDPDTPSPDDWKLKLAMNPRTGKFIDSIQNWDMVRENDPAFRGLYFNQMTLAVETDKDLPWRQLDDGGELFSGVDRAAMAHYLEREYGVRMPRSFVDELINIQAQKRQRHPVREYLLGLKWDGTKRIETCLPGVIPTPYTRMVARKAMTAAAARVLQPGIKWDHTLILYGREGLGKTYWVEKISMGHTATLADIRNKDTLLVMQRSWIMLADEGHSLKKADNDTMKEFLTRTTDVYRLPYDREASAHPRHGVIWGSTNDEVFLRRQEGNRRFLIVHCTEDVDFEALTQEYIDQLWAEAVHLFNRGERLFLKDDESKVAAVERERYTEEDALPGILQAYLDMPVPATFHTRSPEARQAWIQGWKDGFEAPGDTSIDEVCTTQLWVEALGHRLGDHRRLDLLEIGGALKSLGWVPEAQQRKLLHYGLQTVYTRPLI